MTLDDTLMYFLKVKNKIMVNMIVTMALENVSTLNSNVITAPIQVIKAVLVPI